MQSEKLTAYVRDHLQAMAEGMGLVRTPAQAIRERAKEEWASAIGADSAWTRTLKALGLKRETAVDTAARAYMDAAAKVKAALGHAEPTTAEKLQTALAEAQHRVSAAAAAAASSAQQKASDANDAVSAAKDEAAAKTMEALLRARKEADRLLAKHKHDLPDFHVSY